MTYKVYLTNMGCYFNDIFDSINEAIEAGISGGYSFTIIDNNGLFVKSWDPIVGLN